ncbi:hypothetical protein Cs7R123_08280 [Catellatospora sp. TT07R-123]|uniref:hypothetical protein n=1 Tax=Catellatospora sp. TT07R-123 TaxID=2733863 RepID=UPI001AFEAE4E|nr:hypothetical protein [Catellatospora sp. TT07R-123]GHJ43486.1 hypothetical protein Cs7R123_08280 [Catellatospora sp. TT07R-123]
MLRILDSELSPVRSFELGEDVTSFAVSPDLTRVVVGGRDRLSLVGERGEVLWSLRHTPWGTGYSYAGSCEFSADGSLVWATVPETELESDEEDGLYEDEEEDEDQEEDGDGDAPGGGWRAPETWGDQWWAIDAATGSIVGRRWLGCEATGSVTHRHPDGVHMGLDVGEGQDGSRIYWASHDDGVVQVSTTGDVSRALAALHPDGDAYVTVPRDSDGISVHDFATRTVIAHRPNGDLLHSGEWVASARYLDRARVLVETAGKDGNRRRHLVLDAGDLTVLGEVAYPAAVGVSAFHSVHGGTWFTRDGGSLYQWRLEA